MIIKDIVIRKLEKEDYFKSIFEILYQLSPSIDTRIKFEQFSEWFDILPENHHIYVLEYNNNIIGMGTLLIEHKLIHKLGKVGHIEDIVISQEYRGVGLGKYLIKQLMYIAEHDFKSYKVILNCSDLNIPFYESCGLFRHQNQMTFYFC